MPPKVEMAASPVLPPVFQFEPEVAFARNPMSARDSTLDDEVERQFRQYQKQSVIKGTALPQASSQMIMLRSNRSDLAIFLPHATTA